MKLKVNGQELEFGNEMNIIDLLGSFNLQKDRVVVEVNLNIIDEKDYDDFKLKENDAVEIINFVGGG